MVLGRSKQLPRRVLAVETWTSTGENATIKLVSILEPTSAHYAALSYVWGPLSMERMQTTKENVDRWTSGIPYEQLPAVFRDAITVTKSLDIPYLWIDALCIIQDDPKDWTEQIKGMGSIYRNATITIAAACSPNVHTPFLRPRPPKKHDFWLPVTLKMTPGNRSGFLGLRAVRSLDTTRENLTEPIQSRGWTLQERLLSSRTVFFDSEELIWECNTSFHLESIILNAPKEALKWHDAFLTATRVKVDINKRDMRIDPNAGGWYGLINSYQSRDFTFHSDMLPAISSIARLFASHSGFSYVAGLWQEELHLGLTWHWTNEIADSSFDWSDHLAKEETADWKFRQPHLATNVAESTVAPHQYVRAGESKGWVPSVKPMASLRYWKNGSSYAERMASQKGHDQKYRPSWSWIAARAGSRTLLPGSTFESYNGLASSAQKHFEFHG